MESVNNMLKYHEKEKLKKKNSQIPIKNVSVDLLALFLYFFEQLEIRIKSFFHWFYLNSFSFFENLEDLENYFLLFLDPPYTSL